MKVKVKLLSHVWLFATPWTVAYQAHPSMGFSRQECWSGLAFPSPGDLPDPGIKPRSPVLQADALPSEPPGKPMEKSLFLPQFSHFPWINDLHIVPKLWIPEFGGKKCWSWSFSLTASLFLWRNTFLRSLPYHSKYFLCHWDFYVFCYFLLLWTSVYVKTWPQPNFLTMSVYFLWKYFMI